MKVTQDNQDSITEQYSGACANLHCGSCAAHNNCSHATSENDAPIMQDDIPTIQDDELCAIIVHGIVPELMPHVACRRDKHYKASDTKAIKCPYCREVFTVVEASAKLELIRYSHKSKAKVKWHQSKSCGKCRNTVGIIYAISA